MKFVILVMCGPQNGEYQLLEQAIRETWALNGNTVFYNYGDPPGFDAQTSTLALLGRENAEAICVDKTLQALRWAVETLDFDYLFRSNLGSYVNQAAMLDWLKDKPASSYYCGWAASPKEFASGAGFFLSRDLVQLVADHAHVVTGHVDDVAIGKFLLAKGVRTAPAIRVDIQNAMPQTVLQGYAKRAMDFGREPYHYRIRSENRYLDSTVIRRLHENIHAFAP